MSVTAVLIAQWVVYIIGTQLRNVLSEVQMNVDCVISRTIGTHSVQPSPRSYDDVIVTRLSDVYNRLHISAWYFALLLKLGV